MTTRIQRTTYKNPTIGSKVKTDDTELTPQQLADKGYNPIGTEEKVKGGTVFSGSVDPKTGKRFQRFVQDQKSLNGNTGEGNADANIGGTPKITPDGMIKTDTGYRPATPEELGNTGGSSFDIDKYKVSEPSREDIRAEKLADSQAIIDSINEEYNRILQREAQIGEGREGRTRGLNVGSGLSGSDFATAGAMKTERLNEDIQRSYEKERDAKINAILTDVKNETDETYEARRKEFLDQYEDEQTAQKEFAKEQKTEAQSRISTLASTGTKVEDFKVNNSDVYKKLVNNSGLSKVEFDMIWNANLPKANQVKYNFIQDKSGRWFKQGDDGTFNEVEGIEPPDEDPAWEVKPQLDGSMYWVKEDDEGNVIDFKKFQSDTKKSTGIKSQSTIDKETYNENVKTIRNEIVSGVDEEGNPYLGGDGYMAPQAYQEAKTEWIKAGNDPADFDKEFAGFRDPNNPNYNVTGEKNSNQKTNETKQFLNRDFVKKTLTETSLTIEEMLKKMGKERGDYEKSFLGIPTAKTSTEEASIKKDFEDYIEDFVTSSMTKIENYRKANYSDQDILKLIK